MFAIAANVFPAIIRATAVRYCSRNALGRCQQGAGSWQSVFVARANECTTSLDMLCWLGVLRPTGNLTGYTDLIQMQRPHRLQQVAVWVVMDRRNCVAEKSSQEEMSCIVRRDAGDTCILKAGGSLPDPLCCTAGQVGEGIAGPGAALDLKMSVHFVVVWCRRQRSTCEPDGEPGQVPKSCSIRAGHRALHVYGVNV